ncbi:MAG: thermonuclease family protein, partial [Candidatus Sericytochromatia bacterium]|nr:thermonuclease family protein [Candidatus Sericytochromatia bacterium]
MHLATGLRALLGVVSVAWLAACLPLPTAVGPAGASPVPAVGATAGVPGATPGAPTTAASAALPASPGLSAAPSPAVGPSAPLSLAPSASPPSPTPLPASPAADPSPEPAAPLPAFSPPAGADGPWPVTRVVDGDTVHVTTDAGAVTLRLIGVDTPETVHPTQPVGCYGPEASAYTKATLAGQRVWLESDATQDRLDRYGRRLVYVWLQDGTLFNEALIATGHATEYTYSRAYVHQARFRTAQAAARAAGRGLWGACTGLPTPSPLPSPTPAPAVSPPATPAPEAVSATPAPSCPPGERWVNPYVRSDGTQVRGYCRKAS